MAERGPIFEARGIHKWFGPVRALNDVDFAVYPGEIVALIGDNGAGKSTLINVLTGVLPFEEGQIFFEGQPMTFTSTPSTSQATWHQLQAELRANFNPRCRDDA